MQKSFRIFEQVEERQKINSIVLYTLNYNHRIISMGSHWIKWYKIRVIMVIRRYPPSDLISILWFYLDGIKAKKRASVQCKLVIALERKRIIFAEANYGEIKKLVDDSAQRNTKKSTKYNVIMFNISIAQISIWIWSNALYSFWGYKINIAQITIVTVVIHKSNQMLVFDERGKPEYPGKYIWVRSTGVRLERFFWGL